MYQKQVRKQSTWTQDDTTSEGQESQEPHDRTELIETSDELIDEIDELLDEESDLFWTFVESNDYEIDIPCGCFG